MTEGGSLASLLIAQRTDSEADTSGTSVHARNIRGGEELPIACTHLRLQLLGFRRTPKALGVQHRLMTKARVGRLAPLQQLDAGTPRVRTGRLG